MKCGAPVDFSFPASCSVFLKVQVGKRHGKWNGGRTRITLLKRGNVLLEEPAKFEETGFEESYVESEEDAE